MYPIDNNSILLPGQVVTWGSNIGLLIGVRDSFQREGFCVQNLKCWGRPLIGGCSTRKMKTYLLRNSALVSPSPIANSTIFRLKLRLTNEGRDVIYLSPIIPQAACNGYLFTDRNEGTWTSVFFRNSVIYPAFSPRLLILVNIQQLSLYQLLPVSDNKLFTLTQSMGLEAFKDVLDLNLVREGWEESMFYGM